MKIEVRRRRVEIDREDALVRALRRLGAEPVAVDQDPGVLRDRGRHAGAVDLQPRDAPGTLEAAQRLDVAYERGPAREAGASSDDRLGIGELELGAADLGGFQALRGG